jgi:hypothetical protein
LCCGCDRKSINSLTSTLLLLACCPSCRACLQVRLRREKVALSPVYYTALQSETVKAGPFSGFSLASAPGLKDDDSEGRFAAGSVYGSSSSSSGAAAAPGDVSSSTVRGRTPLNAQPAAAAPAAVAGQQGAQAAAPRWGYLRLTSFSQNAAEETKHAIQSLEVGGVQHGAGFTQRSSI